MMRQNSYKRYYKYLALLSLIIVSSCSSVSDEKLLESALDGLISAVENRQRNEVRKYLSNDFLLQRKQGRAEAESLMLFYFRQNKNISLYRIEQYIQINEDLADVTLLILLTGGGGLLPERSGRYQVEMLWRKQESDWLLFSVNWGHS